MVFSHEGVSTPMIAIFNSTPVSTNQAQPLLIAVLLRWRTRQIVTRFAGSDAGLFDSPLTAQDDQRSSVGKIGGERFYGKGVQGADLDSSVAWVSVAKKGVSFNLSSP
jgi:hypothetical protein